MNSWGNSWSEVRRAALAGILVLGVLLAGCPRSPKPDKSQEPPKPTRPLAVGEAQVYEFPSDGRWHPSPFMILNNQVIVMQPVKDSEGLSEQSIRFKVGPVPQMLRAGEHVRFTIPGPLGFKVDPRFAAGLLGPVTVEVKRIK